MNGTLFGVGVGPGDPELLTLRAVRTIREAEVIAVPQTSGGRTVAYDIARPYIRNTSNLLQLDMPMTHDQAALDAAHDEAARIIAKHLSQGCDVAFLTLGDVSLYSTFSYIQCRVEAMGFVVRLIPGVPAVCAVAASLKTPLAEGHQPLSIVPAIAKNGIDQIMAALDEGQNVAVMKAGSRITALRDALEQSGRLSSAAMVERCGLPGERVVRDLSTVDEKSGYFSTVLIKGDRR